MGVINFSSGNVDYVFNGITHAVARTPEKLFDDIDALVIEGVWKREIIPEGGILERALFNFLFGNLSFSTALKEAKIPLFSVDVGIDHKKIDEGFTSYATFRDVIRDIYYGVRYGSSKAKIPEYVQRYLTSAAHFEQSLRVSARSTIAAEKIECSLVKRIREEKGLGNRRLRLGIMYAISHIDLRDYLTDLELRTKTLAHFQESGFSGLVEEDLDALSRYNYFAPDRSNGRGEWRANKEHLGLFEGTRLKRLL